MTLEHLITNGERYEEITPEVLEWAKENNISRTLVAWFHSEICRPANDEKIYELGMTNSDRIMFKMRSNL
jgi:hypothetical protein